MPKVVFRARLRRWGNTFGLTVSPGDVARLRAHEGAEITVLASSGPIHVDFSDIAVLRTRDRHASSRHDELAGQAALDDYERTQGKRGRKT